jgi:hypothetical protein
MAQQTFNEWRKDLSRNVNNKLGVSMNKLPDFPFQDWWKDGISPRDAIDIIRDELGDDHEYEEY